MKKFFFIFLILSVLSGSCLKEIVCIDGDGKITTETRNVSDVTTIINTTPVDLVYRKANSVSVSITAESNLLSHIVTSSSAGRLEVKTSPRNTCFNYSIRPVITVTSPSVNTIEQTGSGLFNADTLSGSLVAVRSTSSGNMFASYLAGDDIEVTMTGSGNVNIGKALSNDADFALTGSGNLEITGAAANGKMRVTGSGAIKSVDFILQSAKETITGSGNIFTHVIISLDAVISGSGNIYLRGDPTVKQSITGSGRIIKY